MSKNRIRLSLDIAKNQHENLKDLVKNKGFTSISDLIREALRLYSYLIEKSNEGFSITLEKEDKREKVYPFR